MAQSPLRFLRFFAADREYWAIHRSVREWRKIPDTNKNIAKF